MMRKIYPYMDGSFLKKNRVYSNSLARFSFPYYALSRGLTVSWFNIRDKDEYKSYYKYEGIGGFYTIKGEGKEYSFNFSRVLNKSQDNNIVRKDRLDSLLDILRIKYPKSVTLKNSTNLEPLRKLSYPIVIKPIFGSMGKGVYANIQNDEELEYALSNQSTGIMAEEYIEGDEYRVYILNGEPIAYCKRHAPSIIGDGVSTVNELIAVINKNKIIKGLAKLPIDEDLNQLLLKQDKNLESIVPIGERVILSNKKGRSSGAMIETVSFINYEVYEGLRTIGQYLDTFYMIGVDCIVKDNELFVLEINLRPQISSAVIPDEGPAINIPKIVVDNLFGPYKGDYLVPDNFMKNLQKLDRLKELDWKEMICNCKQGISLTL